jgi:excisionase family DNA binding protein
MPEEEYYTAEEIANILRIAEDSVTRLLRTNKMPGYKVAGSWRINKAEFREYMAKMRNIPLKDQQRDQQK